MTIQLSTTDKRDLAALAVFAAADTWQHKITLRDGRRVYGIPSRSEPGTLRLTDGVSCNCPDAQRRNIRCAHIRAAALYRMKRAADLGGSAPEPAVVYAAHAALSTAQVMAEAREAAQQSASHLPAVRTIRPTRYDAIFGPDQD